MIPVSPTTHCSGKAHVPPPTSVSAPERPLLTLRSPVLPRMISIPGALFFGAPTPVRRRRQLQPAARVLARVLAVTQSLWFDDRGATRPLAAA